MPPGRRANASPTSWLRWSGVTAMALRAGGSLPGGLARHRQADGDVLLAELGDISPL